MQKPSLGRVVQYLCDGKPLVAFITGVHNDTAVDLTVLTIVGCEDVGGRAAFQVTSAVLGTSDRTWQWPVFVAPTTPPAPNPAIVALQAQVAQLQTELAAPPAPNPAIAALQAQVAQLQTEIASLAAAAPAPSSPPAA